LLRRIRDFAQVAGKDVIDREIADKSLLRLEIDEFGLDDMDKRILSAVINKFGGGPVGLNTLAITVGESSDTLEEMYEPFLIKEGFMNRTTRGRVATDRAYSYLGISRPTNEQGKLF
jgi:Holliday junction DNA helicase RuvB